MKWGVINLWWLVTAVKTIAETECQFCITRIMSEDIQALTWVFWWFATSSTTIFFHEQKTDFSPSLSLYGWVASGFHCTLWLVSEQRVGCGVASCRVSFQGPQWLLYLWFCGLICVFWLLFYLIWYRLTYNVLHKPTKNSFVFGPWVGCGYLF